MKLLPIGIENFKEMIDKNYYYIDKTDLISDVVKEKVVFYTRPRRFGKTLNMSMLNYFFSIKEKENAYLFDSLKVLKNAETMKHQNQYPVIFLSLKDLKCSNIQEQIEQFAILIKDIVISNSELLDSNSIDEADKKILNNIRFLNATKVQLKNSLSLISKCLMKYYKKKVIILIDEYDVPLQTAYNYDYYEEMVEFLKNVFSSVLKTNDSLEKGIMTGCLRISKESIFTGLNNFNVCSILDYQNEESFGFKEDEVKQILTDYSLIEYLEEVKDWYDGYLFGEKEIYNPWSTINYINRKLSNKSASPISFWANTSGNEIIYDYIRKANHDLYDEFEELMRNKSIVKMIKPELTYREMDDINNIYSFLLLTGYLKINEDKGNNVYSLIIPNKEVYEIYRTIFMSYFTNYTNEKKGDLYHLLKQGNTTKANALLNDILSKSISYYDNHENFYHGLLIGLFNEYTVESNKEAGDGRFDICILPRTISDTVVVIECKHSIKINDLRKDASNGVNQIKEKRYLEDPKLEIYQERIGYGIAFYKKQCFIEKVED